jgi:hypothetical protein
MLETERVRYLTDDDLFFLLDATKKTHALLCHWMYMYRLQEDIWDHFWDCAILSQGPICVPHIVDTIASPFFQLADDFYDDEVVDSCTLVRSFSAYQIHRNDIRYIKSDMDEPKISNFVFQKLTGIRELVLEIGDPLDLNVFGCWSRLEAITVSGSSVTIPHIPSLRRVVVHDISRAEASYIDVTGIVRLDLRFGATILKGNASSIRWFRHPIELPDESLGVMDMTGLHTLVAYNTTTCTSFPPSLRILKIMGERNLCIPENLTELTLLMFGKYQHAPCISYHSSLKRLKIRGTREIQPFVVNQGLQILEVTSTDQFLALQSLNPFKNLKILKIKESTDDILSIPPKLQILHVGQHKRWEDYMLGVSKTVVELHVKHTYIFWKDTRYAQHPELDLSEWTSLKMLYLHVCHSFGGSHMRFTDTLRAPSSLKHIIIRPSASCDKSWYTIHHHGVDLTIIS